VGRPESPWGPEERRRRLGPHIHIPERVVRCFLTLDHISVLLLMLGSNLPMIYFGFIDNASFISALHTVMSINVIALAIGALQFDQL